MIGSVSEEAFTFRESLGTQEVEPYLLWLSVNWSYKKCSCFAESRYSHIDITTHCNLNYMYNGSYGLWLSQSAIERSFINY